MLASNLYIIVGSALVVGLILTIFLMIDKYMKVFSRSGGIMLSLGIRRYHLYALLLIQLLMLCAIAIPISFGLTVLGYHVINFVVRWATGINLALSILRIIAIFGLGVAVVVVIALGFFALATLRLRHRTIKQFLSAEVN